MNIKLFKNLGKLLKAVRHITRPHLISEYKVIIRNITINSQFYNGSHVITNQNRYRYNKHNKYVAPNIIIKEVPFRYINQNGDDVGHAFYQVIGIPNSIQDIREQVERHIPRGYHLASDKPINVRIK